MKNAHKKGATFQISMGHFGLEHFFLEKWSFFHKMRPLGQSFDDITMSFLDQIEKSCSVSNMDT